MGYLLVIGALNRENSGPLFVSVVIAFADFEHCVVVVEEFFEVAAEVIDFVADTCVGHCSVAPQGLECALADVQDLHYVLAVKEVTDKVGRELSVTFHYSSSFRKVLWRGPHQR